MSFFNRFRNPANPTPPADNPAVAFAIPVFTAGEPTPAQVAQSLIDRLRPLVPTTAPTVPDEAITLEAVESRPLAIGNMRGVERLGQLEVGALKGGRLQATIRIELWAQTANEVNALVDTLLSNLLANQQPLRQDGVLELKMVSSSVAENVTGSLWRRVTSWQTLYEYHYRDEDGALSLITQIPVSYTGEFSDQQLVTGRIVRWDDQAAPTLLLHGPTQIRSIELLSFLPTTAPAGAIRLRRTHTGATGAPTPFTALPDWLNALDSGNRHAELTLPDLAALLALATPLGGPVTLGDLDEDGVLDAYTYAVAELFPTIQLPATSDQLEIVFDGGPFTVAAALYVQLS